VAVVLVDHGDLDLGAHCLAEPIGGERATCTATEDYDVRDHANIERR
jgi:hypothetical protein